MKAVVFDASIGKYLATRALGTLSRRLMVGPGRSTRLAEVPEPPLPGDGWVRVKTRLGGICGSDLAMVGLTVSPATSPFSSSPFVIGHENVGAVSEAGDGVRSFVLGDRVVVNPLLSCRVRGIDPVCPPCAAGREAFCERMAGDGHPGEETGDLPPGMILGTTRGVGGSWGESFVAHESRLHRVPDKVNDRSAVLVEPFASSLDPVLAHPPAEGERVFVIGAGTIGLFAVAALKAVAPACDVTVLARYAFQAEEARRLGADRVVRASRGEEGVEALSRLSGGRLLRPILGKRIQVGGFDRTFVCVGGAAAVTDAMRFTRAGGTVEVLGNLWRLKAVDWTPLWMKGLVMRGSLCYGAHEFEGPRRHTLDVALDFLQSGRVAALEPLLTHTVPIDELERGLALAFGRARERSVKVAFSFEN